MRSRAGRVARGLWLLAMVLAAGFAVLIVATLGSPHSIFGGYPAAQLVSAAAIVTVAAVVSSRVPGNPVGWLFFLLGFGNLTTNVAGLYAIRGLELAPGSLPLVVPVAWLGTWSWIGQLIALPLLMPLFPNGEPLTRRWRPIVWLQVAAGSMAMITWAVISFPIAGWRLDSHGEITNNPPAAAGILVSLLLVTVIALLAAAAVSSVLRLGRSTGEQRQQLKGFVAGGALVSGNSAVLIGMLVSGQADQVLQPVASALNLSIGVLALASGLAILRYRLYDIDIVISRTLVYGGLAVAITAVYLGLIVGVGSLVGSRSGLVLTVVATAIVGLAFQPARARLQRYANRLVYGRRATPYEVLSDFSERVADAVATDDVPSRMAQVLADATAAEHADVWLRIGDLLRPAASWPVTASRLTPVPVTGHIAPAIPNADRAVAVLHQGELLGMLSVVKRPDEEMTPVEEKLLDDLARQAGLVLRNARLAAELLERMEELRASRQRLVSAQDEERRRLERNLHDGAQQHLVALKVKLGLLEALNTKAPDKATALVGELKRDADEALETLRDLARGIYPPLLAEKGLAAALESQARKATVPVAVEADGIGRYPQDIEAAVYFCVLEALQNVQKYAHADHATVRLAEAAGALTFEVEDDGDGFDDTTVKNGSGLTNMGDRLDALSGSLDIDSSPGHGTRVRGNLPARELEVVE